MAATYQVVNYTGAGPTKTAWAAGLLFHRADTNQTVAGSCVPIPIPAAGNAWSWRKWVKLEILTTPVGLVTNLRWFSDAVAMGTGVIMRVAQIATYAQATSADETAVIGGSPVDATTLTSASPKVVNAGTVITNPSTGVGTQDHMCMQVEVASTASPGTTAARTYSYRVDET